MANTCDVLTLMSSYCETAPMIEAAYLRPDNATKFMAAEEADAEVAFVRFNRLGNALNAINHVFMCCVVVGICWKCLQLKLEKTAMHAYLCTLGYVLLFAEGLIVRHGGNMPMISLEPTSRVWLYTLLQIVGGGLGLAGTLHKMYSKKKHFHTVHGKLGLVSCVFWLVNFLTGFGILNSVAFRRNLAPLLTKILHHLLDLITFLIGMAAQYTGYETGFFRRNFEGREKYKYLTVLIMIMVTLAPVLKSTIGIIY